MCMHICVFVYMDISTCVYVLIDVSIYINYTLRNAMLVKSFVSFS